MIWGNKRNFDINAFVLIRNDMKNLQTLKKFLLKQKQIEKTEKKMCKNLINLQNKNSSITPFYQSQKQTHLSIFCQKK